MDPYLDIVCVDFAKSAVELLQGEIAKRSAPDSLPDPTAEGGTAEGGEGSSSSSAAAPALRGTVVASVCDVTKDDLPVEPNSVDLVLCMFVVSAIAPEVCAYLTLKKQSVANLTQCL
jgi:hypothetical protein